MTLALVLIFFAVLSLVVILRLTFFGSLQVAKNRTIAAQIQPIDIEAFRNLLDPLEDEFLSRRLQSAELRVVRRERLRAMAAYVRAAARNAAVLVRMGQNALAAGDPRTAEAARQLMNDALLLRRNATIALFQIYISMAWPGSLLTAAPLLHRYQHLDGSAMLLGRLQNPAAPVRISAR